MSSFKINPTFVNNYPLHFQLNQILGNLKVHCNLSISFYWHNLKRCRNQIFLLYLHIKNYIQPFIVNGMQCLL